MNYSSNKNKEIDDGVIDGDSILIKKIPIKRDKKANLGFQARQFLFSHFKDCEDVNEAVMHDEENQANALKALCQFNLTGEDAEADAKDAQEHIKMIMSKLFKCNAHKKPWQKDFVQYGIKPDLFWQMFVHNSREYRQVRKGLEDNFGRVKITDMVVFAQLFEF